MKAKPKGFDLILPPSARQNALYYGDNLTIMQNMPSACVDLIYLDPPFNSQRTYNLIYKQRTGLPLPEQEDAFCDTWDLDPEKEEMARNMPMVLREYGTDESLVQFWVAWIKALREAQPNLLAYMIYMTNRLFEMRRLLKPTGSIYLHCDASASHYIKVMMDSIFGASNFRDEIIWKRQSAHSDATTKFPVVNDSYSTPKARAPSSIVNMASTIRNTLINFIDTMMTTAAAATVLATCRPRRAAVCRPLIRRPESQMAGMFGKIISPPCLAGVTALRLWRVLITKVESTIQPWTMVRRILRSGSH
jgi:hypothetical protein